MKFVGTAVSKILHGLRGAIGDAVATAIRSKMCNVLHTAVLPRVNERLSSMPNNLTFHIRNETFALKYQLTEHPIVNERYVDVPIDAKVEHEGSEGVTINSTMNPSDGDSNSMVRLTVSKDVPQSLLTR